MMSHRVEQSLWLITALIAIGAVAKPLVKKTTYAVSVPRALDGAAIASAMSAPPDRLVSLVQQIIAADVFRPQRHAPVVTAQPSAPPAPTRPQVAPRPRLILRGLVGGPPWDAIIEGVPGHEGSYVVRSGDSVAGLKIRSVRRNGAIIRGMDTTWILSWGRAP